MDLIQAADADGDPRDVFEMIEEEPRARLAVPVGRGQQVGKVRALNALRLL